MNGTYFPTSSECMISAPSLVIHIGLRSKPGRRRKGLLLRWGSPFKGYRSSRWIFRESVVRRSLALLIFVVSLEVCFSVAHKLIYLQI